MVFRVLRLLAAVGVVSAGGTPNALADSEAYALQCEAAIVAGARRGGVPVEVLHAIALTETGRNSNGRMRPWPWAINREGEGFWFENRTEALAFAEASIAAGRPSFDVGCVQINYRWHGHAFPSIGDMLDPEWTATYAAQFLRTLYEERGSWSAAAGAYHSLTPELAGRYRERFDRILAGLAPLAIDETMVAALPERGSTRAERRAAARRVAAERIAAMGPPPEPVMGSLAGGLMVPAAGGLLTGGTPLLSQGTPLLVQPGAGLF
jgi:hypothetical protein